jgi:hypothetical protein
MNACFLSTKSFGTLNDMPGIGQESAPDTDCGFLFTIIAATLDCDALPMLFIDNEIDTLIVP